MNLESVLIKEIEEKKGVLKMKPAFVAGTSYRGLGRLGLRRFCWRTRMDL
ncbi:MAG: hypothetical protein ACUVQ8_02700 [Nitrososphaeria archaeon]